MMECNGKIDWNGMLISWIVLMGFHLVVMTIFEQRPPFNKDHIKVANWHDQPDKDVVNYLQVKTTSP